MRAFAYQSLCLRKKPTYPQDLERTIQLTDMGLPTINPDEGTRKSPLLPEGNKSIAKRIDKFERQLIEEKLLLVDDDGKPLPKVVSTVNVNSESEVEEETKRDDNYDPYDDDLYDSHDMYDNLQAICDELDITYQSQVGPVVAWMVFPRLDPGPTVLVDPGKPSIERKPVKGGVF
ncbi:hypothetical protein Tco_0883877 [Tanacetum coccineum]